LDGKAKPGTTYILWSTVLQGGMALENSSVITFENLFSESKIQEGACLAPCGFGSLWETLQNIKTKKLINFNSLTKTTKLTPTSVNAKLYYASKFTNLEPTLV
jgi:hypothetical protein